MSTAVFDTLKASDTLKAAGIEARQAEAIVHTMAGAFEDTVATKADLMAVEAELKQDIASTKADLMEVKGELKQEIAFHQSRPHRSQGRTRAGNRFHQGRTQAGYRFHQG